MEEEFQRIVGCFMDELSNDEGIAEYVNQYCIRHNIAMPREQYDNESNNDYSEYENSAEYQLYYETYTAIITQMLAALITNQRTHK